MACDPESCRDRVVFKGVFKRPSADGDLALGDSLLPGAADFLAKGAADKWGVMSPDKRAEAIAAFLDGPVGSRWKNPEFVAAKLENGAEFSPLRRELSRYPELKPEAVDKLVSEWSAATKHQAHAQLAGEVARRLGRPENARHLISPTHKLFERAWYGGTRPAPASPEPARQDDGRFAGKPAEKPRAKVGSSSAF